MPAGDRYVEVTLEDMERFLKRAFRALRPKKGESRGEVYYDLNLSDDEVIVRVWTSIHPRRGSGAGVGEDAIRVTMITKGGKALMPKSKIVMRTKNWRNALQDRIEELHEIYESKAEYWKHKRRERDGDAAPTPERETWRSQHRDDEEEIRQERENSEEPAPREPASGPGLRKTKPGEGFEGTYRSVGPGEWGVQITTPGEPGLVGMAVTKGGQRRKVRLKTKVKSFKDQYNGGRETELWTFEDASGKPRQQGYGGGRWAAEDPVAESVAVRYLSA
jgi:hypothetical protein